MILAKSDIPSRVGIDDGSLYQISHLFNCFPITDSPIGWVKIMAGEKVVDFPTVEKSCIFYNSDNIQNGEPNQSKGSLSCLYCKNIHR